MRTFPILGFLLLAGSTWASGAFAAPAGTDPLQQAIQIKGILYDNYGVTFQVSSGGCTTKDGLAVVMVPNSTPVQVILTRTLPDPCEAYLPMGVKIHYTWHELGLEGKSFTIMNPVIPGPIDASPMPGSAPAPAPAQAD